MDLPSFLIGLLPVVAIGFVSVVAFRRRRDRRGFPLILNPYTLAVEPDATALGHLPVEQPAPPSTSSRKVGTSSQQADTNSPEVRPLLPPNSPTPSTKA